MGLSGWGWGVEAWGWGVEAWGWLVRNAAAAHGEPVPPRRYVQATRPGPLSDAWPHLCPTPA